MKDDNLNKLSISKEGIRLDDFEIKGLENYKLKVGEKGYLGTLELRMTVVIPKKSY